MIAPTEWPALPAPRHRVTPAIAREAFAAMVLARNAAPYMLGDIELRPHQVEAVERLRGALKADGGVLLADTVGLGKTYVALALAAEHGGALVVAPAALRAMWRDAAARTQVANVDFVSFETLSRGWIPPRFPPLLLVDEAHHVRTRTTRRYRELAALASRGAPVVLLSATPVHNRESDLATILSLFLGARAFRVSLRRLQRHVVRRTPRDLEAPPAIPRVAAPRLLSLPADDDLLDAIAAIPPAVPPSDGGTAHALCKLGLVRAWASSDGALVFALRRRLATARALQSAFDEGRYPSRQALTAWTVGDDAVQLAFPSLVAAPVAPDTPIDALRDAVTTHADALRELLARLSTASARDAARAAHLAEFLDEPGARVLAFSHSAETVHALFRHLRAVPGVCELTGHGAGVAGGRLSRIEAIARFAPRSSGARDPRPADVIRLLIATDLLSEGLNLQDASVVVHLDLPWTAARLEQRVGRVVRPGSTRDVVDVYAMAAPASGAAALRVETRHRAKLEAASRAVGSPSIGALLSAADTAAPSDVELTEQIRRVLRTWRNGHGADRETTPDRGAGTCIATIASGCSGWIAAVRCPGRHGPATLVADLGDGPSTSPTAIFRALTAAAGGCEVDACALAIDRAAAALTRWLAERDGARLVGTEALASASIRQVALRRIAEILDRAPTHRRSTLAVLAAAARIAVNGAAGAVVDAGLLAAAGELDDERWLGRVASLDVTAPSVREAPAQTAAVVLLVLRGALPRRQ